jgi:16S rRNA A1518/A1519 N6-dimethyltransferase RsmA/KsgA/DIM1 with predicted DNA glycosylase/AP lyase activity
VIVLVSELPWQGVKMSIHIDPEQNEIRALTGLIPGMSGKSVLEIGSGDGRLTWRYAASAARVVAIEPDAGKYAASLVNRPREWEHVEFFNLGLDAFVQQNKERFDLSILSWSL